MFKKIALVLLAAISSPTLVAQNADRMDQVVTDFASREEFSGSVLVAQDGNIILDKGYGMANREWSIPNNGDTKFRLASLTKQFTAVAIMQLVERGVLSLDAPIQTYLPDAPLAWDAVTIRHLLTHTSGIPNFTDFDDFERQKRQASTLLQLIGRFRERDLAFEPGQKWEYSNSNYTLLTAIIERVGGMPYADFLSLNLFVPLGMADTGYDTQSLILPNRASGYVPTPGGIRNADFVDMSIPQGAGGLYSTTHDLLTWNRALYGQRILEPQSMELLTTPLLNGYAFGLMANVEGGHNIISHTGGIEGFNTYLGYDETSMVTVAVLGNLNGPAPGRIGDLLMAVARGEQVVLASERTPITLDPTVLTEYEGEYEITSDFILKLAVVDGTLTAQATGQDAFPLYAEARDEFFLQVVDAQISMVRNESGDVTGLILLQGGRETPAARR